MSALGLSLPAPPQPKGAYVPVLRHGDLAWVSGMLPLENGKLVVRGTVEAEVSVAAAYEAARLATLGGLAALKSTLGDLRHVARILRVGVFVASAPGFTRQPEVANGASELLLALWGEDGKHARVAVGVAQLPLGSPVEVELLVATR